MNGAIDTAITGSAGVVAVLALVVAFYARRDARRSAVAAEESARQARRSADADERAVALAAAEAEQRAAAQHDADGPTFERVSGTLTPRKGGVRLRVVGGPGRVTVSALITDAPWCLGFDVGEIGWDGGAQFGELEPGDTFQRALGLSDDRDQTRMQVVLPLMITAVSHEQPPRTWVRRVPVLLEPGPRIW